MSCVNCGGIDEQNDDRDYCKEQHERCNNDKLDECNELVGLNGDSNASYEKKEEEEQGEDDKEKEEKEE